MERYKAKKQRDYWLLWDTEENRKASSYKYDSFLQCQSVADRWNRDLNEKLANSSEEDVDAETSGD